MKTDSYHIEQAISELIDKYQSYPNNYFSECELQYELYFILKSSKHFDLTLSTTDNRVIKIVHPEYPSVERIQLKKGKGYRVWFDLAILNPQFVTNNTYQTVLAKNETHAVKYGSNLLAAFEFKFFPVIHNTDFDSVIEDCEKLNKCTEIANRFVLAFSSYQPDLSNLKHANLDQTKLYWITPLSIKIFN